MLDKLTGINRESRLGNGFDSRPVRLSKPILGCSAKKLAAVWVRSSRILGTVWHGSSMGGPTPPWKGVVV